MANRTLDELAAGFWDLLMEAGPSAATLLGDHRFDDRIEDLSAEAEAELRGRLAGFAERARAIPEGELSAPERVTRDMLAWEAERHVEEIDAGMVELQCDQMIGPHAHLLRTAGQVTLPEPEHARAIVGRYEKIGGFLDQACDRLRAGVAKGRPPARITVERSVSTLDGYLGSPLESDLFVSVRGPEGWDGEAEWRRRLEEVVSETVRPAMARYRRFLAEELLPAARPDDRSGLVWLEGGEEIYRSAMAIHTGLDLTPEGIHRTGVEEATERLPAEYREIGQPVLGVEDVDGIFDRLRRDPDLRYSSADEMRRLATASLERAREAIGDWFGVVPATPCEIRDVPAFLAADVPPAYYLPPSDDGTRPGTYFLNVHAPEEKNRYEAESIAFHEAIPGHHLQIAIAAELEGIPDFQRHAWATAYAEGWGLYAERLADEMGLYSDDLQRLGMLAADSWRAGRLVVDTGIHALGWSRREAIDFLTRHTPIGEEAIVIEVDRYIGWPGQALAYKVGQREIFRLRQEAEETLGATFRLPAFHDAVLTSGAVALPILRSVISDWVEGEREP